MPRKLRADSVRIAPATPSVAVTRTDAIAFGRIWRKMIRGSPDHLSPYPSERDGVGPGHGDARRGGRDPHGVRPELPRYRGSAAHAELGEHPHGGEGQHRHRLVALLLSGARHPDHRPR